ncbi:MAG: T9SS type A sorting domain-containing protein [Bacteroidia bacterium]|nr:T9SS type A sorting domain-containing protein [Bacteroidia bacterium]
MKNLVSVPRGRTAFAVTALLFGFFAVRTAMAQNYREVQDFGWGIGVNRPSPVIIDLDGNGRLDMLVGTESGVIMRFEQTAVNGQEFRLLDRRFMKLRNASQAALTVADIDSDGRLDLLVGESGGRLVHYVQTAPGVAEFEMVTNYFGAITTPASPNPFFTDIEGDGLLDLIYGSSSGKIERYTQDAPQSTNFVKASNLKFDTNLGSSNRLGVSDFDADGALDVVMGSWDGDVMHFEAHETVKDSFLLVEKRWSGIPKNTLGAPFFIDVDNDGLLDCFIGYGAGTVEHREQSAANSTQFSNVLQHDVLNAWDFGRETIFAVTDLDRDGRLDILRSDIPMGESYMLRHPLMHMTQTAPGALTVTVVSNNFNDIRVQQSGSLSFTDLNGDGRLDLFIARLNQDTIYQYQQKADAPFEFEMVPGSFLAGQIQTNGNIQPLVFRDLDNDGLLDLLVACGRMDHFEQDAPGSSSFALKRENVIWSNLVNRGRGFAVEDLDGDGVLEMLVGNGGVLALFRQTQLHGEEFVKVADTLAGIDVYSGAIPYVADVNNDGRLDIIVGDDAGGLCLFLETGPNASGEVAHLPASPKLLDISPHPVNTYASVRVAMPVDERATVALYDLLGRERQTVASHRLLTQGVTPLEIDGRGLPPGCYLLVLEAGGIRVSKPVMIMR